MEFEEKVIKRLTHWMEHNEKHAQEYTKLAQELLENGYEGASKHVLSLATISQEMNREIEKALDEIKR